MNHHMITPDMLARFPLLLTCAACLAACDPGPASGTSTCPEEECGVNASTLNDLLFGENHLTPGMNNGNPNEAGARIADFVFVDASLDALLIIANGTLEVAVNGQRLSGEAILGSKLVVEDMRSPMTGRKLIDVYFHDTRMMPTWTSTQAPISQYLLAYENDRGEYVSVCSGAGNIDDPAAWAVLLTGEKYSIETRSVIGAEAGIFNIACFGTALYKMKMMGYEPLMEPESFVKEHQRQATLKMLMADYCDTGRTFTEDGTPLQWLNSGGWSFNYPEQSGIVESYWTPDGALCLSNPRLGPEKLAEILEDCASVGKELPPCDGFAGDYEWVTSLP